METIVKAKDQQAAEANKNASILLKELDLEKVQSDHMAVLWDVKALIRQRAFCSFLVVAMQPPNHLSSA